MKNLLIFMGTRAASAWILTTDPKAIGVGLLLTLIALVTANLLLLKRATRVHRYLMVLFSITGLL